MKTMYVWTEKNGKQESVARFNVTSETDLTRFIIAANEHGYKYNIIENGKIIHTNTNNITRGF